MDFRFGLAVGGATLVTGTYLVCVTLVLRSTWRTREARRAMTAGRYAEAEAMALRIEASPVSIFPSVRHGARYAVAAAMHLQGRLEEALAALEPLDRDRAKLSPALRYAVCSLEAGILVLLDRDADRVETLLGEARRKEEPAEDLILRALAAQALGQEERAENLVRRATAEWGEDGGAPRALGDDKGHRDAIFHALRGLYLARSGQDATGDLSLAAEAPFTNVYTRRARELLAGGAVDAGVTEEEEPSSLAPQVVASRGEE